MPTQIRFLLQDPQALTGSPDRDRLVPAQLGQTILQVALAAGIQIEHACGGVGGCSTCHVYINKGIQSLSPPSDSELDRLDEAPNPRPHSRLSCQATIIRENEQIEVEVPAWNRNLVREHPH